MIGNRRLAARAGGCAPSVLLGRTEPIETQSGPSPGARRSCAYSVTQVMNPVPLADDVGEPPRPLRSIARALPGRCAQEVPDYRWQIGQVKQTSANFENRQMSAGRVEWIGHGICNLT